MHGDKVDEVRQPINICLRARVVGGKIEPDPSEAAEVWWVNPADLDGYPIHPALRARIDHGLKSAEPYIS
jgi:hypothetical protein